MIKDLAENVTLATVSAIVSWAGAMWVYRDKKLKEKGDQDDRLEIHRDDLTFELLKTAREEVAGARVEMESLRDEVQTLRALEQHFYHFLQALDHLEAILYATDETERQGAERAAKAFVTRMRRLNEAKGTVANEVQRAGSAVRLAERKISPMNDKGPTE